MIGRATFLVMFLLTLPGYTAGKDPSWQAKMKSLAETMGELLPELASSNSDPKIIKRGAKKLSQLTHDLKEGRKSGKSSPPADVDPSVLYLADQFSSRAKQAYSVIQQGNLEYGKSMLRAVTAYCIACHTRHENGPDFANFPMSPKVSSLNKQEKAELLIATRQFDKALVALQELIADPQWAKNQPFAWERPVRDALSIAVRVKKDPTAAAAIVTSALQIADLPEFEQMRLKKWKLAVEAWKAEPATVVNTEAGYAAEMRRLLGEAAKTQLYPIDRSAEIQYLRASAAAHDILRVGKDPALIGEALQGAGVAYEVLANPILWPMHEFYYEACIRHSPHSELSEQCFARFEQSVYFGYSGSSGMRLPSEIKNNLEELRKLAAPKVQQGK